MKKYLIWQTICYEVEAESKDQALKKLLKSNKEDYVADVSEYDVEEEYKAK
jgi:hypothetical protein